METGNIWKLVYASVNQMHTFRYIYHISFIKYHISYIIYTNRYFCANADLYINLYISYIPPKKSSISPKKSPKKILHSAYWPTKCNFRLHCQQTAFQKCHKLSLESVQGRSEFSQQFACLTPQSKTNPGIKKVYSLKLTWAMKIGLKCPKRNRIVLEAVFFKGYAAMWVLGRVSHHGLAIRWKFL